MTKTLRFIDLFAGLGGTRIGFEQACSDRGLKAKCVFTSEIKRHAIKIYQHNFSNDQIAGDITQINAADLPDFDYLLGGFPCQAFSTAGKKHGFLDTRGTLFFDIARIIKHKKPKGFLLENVEGLVTHDRRDRTSPIGNTLKVILGVLEDLGYQVRWKVLDAKDFGVPQERKRIYIAGTLMTEFHLENFEVSRATFGSIKESGLPALKTDFTEKLLKLYPNIKELSGKAIKDKRGGINNIHSWDLELKGELNGVQKEILSTLLRERRKRQWADLKGIAWMDGMPLTLDEIHSFYNFVDKDELRQQLESLVEKKYLRFEHPKDLVEVDGIKKREYATHLQKGYNIVTGKLSFELNKILGDDAIAPTIVATEADRIGVIDGDYIRRMSERECLRLFGFPETYKSNISHKDLYDLIGNTVVIPVIKKVAERII